MADKKELQVKNFIFHKLVTVRAKSSVTVEHRKKAFKLPNPNVDTLVKAIISSFENDGAVAYAGIENPSWFDSKTKSYFSGSQDVDLFYTYSKDLAEKLKVEMGQEPLTTTGYLTIIDYEVGGKRFLMLVLIKDQKGIGITDDMDLEEVVSLSIDKLHFAARLNIERWGSEEDDKRKNHIAFLKGRNRNGEVVGYFKALLSIDEEKYFDPVKHTKDLVGYIKNYCLENLDDETAMTARRQVMDWANNQISLQKPITLRGVSSIIDPDEPDKFIQYLAGKNIEINSEFIPVDKELKNLMKFKVYGPKKQYTLMFEQSAVEADLIFKNSKGQVVINGVPDDILESLPVR